MERFDPRFPLVVAAARGHVTVVQALLAKGAHIEAVDNKGRTALQIASENGMIDVVRLLLANGANVETVRLDKLDELQFINPPRCREIENEIQKALEIKKL